MSEPQLFETDLWCCVGTNFKRPYYNWSTLSYTRTDSIKKCQHGTIPKWSWRKFKRRGWVCIKVKMSLTPIK